MVVGREQESAAGEHNNADSRYAAKKNLAVAVAWVDGRRRKRLGAGQRIGAMHGIRVRFAGQAGTERNTMLDAGLLDFWGRRVMCVHVNLI